MLRWCNYVPYRGGRRDVEAGEDTLLLGKVLLVACRKEAHNDRVRDQSATEGGSRVPDCPLNHVSFCMYNLLGIPVTINSTSRTLIVSDCLLTLIQSTETFPLVIRHVISYRYALHRFIATGT